MRTVKHALKETVRPTLLLKRGDGNEGQSVPWEEVFAALAIPPQVRLFVLADC